MLFRKIVLDSMQISENGKKAYATKISQKLSYIQILKEVFLKKESLQRQQLNQLKAKRNGISFILTLTVQFLFHVVREKIAILLSFILQDYQDMEEDGELDRGTQEEEGDQ
eukprot:TRINITY_DN0_c339_g2_i1.p2 TRINITY_DN0_c339_g2~~TRINITY_DN0_c339_g2_i1.p2  ORF type:complete len:111 (-),score=8.25 TRINITY_DN0_c339_g2_i1:1-333(-)